MKIKTGVISKALEFDIAPFNFYKSFISHSSVMPPSRLK